MSALEELWNLPKEEQDKMLKLLARRLALKQFSRMTGLPDELPPRKPQDKPDNLAIRNKGQLDFFQS